VWAFIECLHLLVICLLTGAVTTIAKFHVSDWLSEWREECVSHSSYYDNCSKKRNAARPFGYKGRRSRESSLGRSSKEGELGPRGAEGVRECCTWFRRLCRWTNGKCTRRSTRLRCFSVIVELEFGLGVNVEMRGGARGKTGRPDCKSSKSPTRSCITDVRADWSWKSTFSSTIEILHSTFHQHSIKGSSRGSEKCWVDIANTW